MMINDCYSMPSSDLVIFTILDEFQQIKSKIEFEKASLCNTTNCSLVDFDLANPHDQSYWFLIVRDGANIGGKLELVLFRPSASILQPKSSKPSPACPSWFEALSSSRLAATNNGTVYVSCYGFVQGSYLRHFNQNIRLINIWINSYDFDWAIRSMYFDDDGYFWLKANDSVVQRLGDKELKDT